MRSPSLVVNVHSNFYMISRGPNIWNRCALAKKFRISSKLDLLSIPERSIYAKRENVFTFCGFPDWQRAIAGKLVFPGIWNWRFAAPLLLLWIGGLC